MKRVRVLAFIDGFNLYHSIVNLKIPHLKWLDLSLLSKIFVKPQSEELKQVIYFSAYSTHLNESIQKRQKAYIMALKIKGVRTVLGHFKRKNRRCPDCRHTWIGHEEKATDVNIALHLLDLAYQDEFDRAILITNDSDLAPAISLVRERFPDKRITTVAPPRCCHSNELIQASTDKSKIRLEHLEKCLLPAFVTDGSGLISVQRPAEYAPAEISV